MHPATPCMPVAKKWVTIEPFILFRIIKCAAVCSRRRLSAAAARVYPVEFHSEHNSMVSPIVSCIFAFSQEELCELVARAICKMHIRDVIAAVNPSARAKFFALPTCTMYFHAEIAEYVSFVKCKRNINNENGKGWRPNKTYTTTVAHTLKNVIRIVMRMNSAHRTILRNDNK